LGITHKPRSQSHTPLDAAKNLIEVIRKPVLYLIDIIIQELLGHATPKTTADYYIHPSEKRVREALEKMSGVIYMTQLVNDGFIKFQSNYQKRE